MDQDITFRYQYSAKENKEIQEIRKKYLPQSESKLDELKRLDGKVQTSGMMASLCVGIGGALVLGLGMCLSMQVIGSGAMSMLLGVLLGLIGAVAIALAYPVYRAIYCKTKEKYAPRILELASELSGQSSVT